MAGLNRITRPLLVILMTLATLALATILIVEATDRLSSAAPSNLEAALVCQNTQSCVVEATLTAEDRDVSGVLVAEIEGGVRFRDSNGRLVIDRNGHRAVTVGNVTIPAGELRQIIFPLHPDRSTLFSGAYVMTLRLAGSGVEESRYTQQLPVHVLIQDSGDVHMMNSSTVLDAAIGAFRPGTGNLAYAVDVDPLSRTQGAIFVRVNGVDNAEVALSVPDGVLFTATGTTSARVAAGLIRPDGYRILPFPFQHEPGSYTGPRHITAGLNLGAGAPALELLPYQLVVNDGGPTGKPFIEVVPAEAAPTDTIPDLGQGSGAAFIWDRRVENFSGSLFDGYEAYVRGQVAMDWETFREQVLLFNPSLRQTGNIFQAGRVYLLPRPDAGTGR